MAVNNFNVIDYYSKYYIKTAVSSDDHQLYLFCLYCFVSVDDDVRTHHATVEITEKSIFSGSRMAEMNLT